MRANPYLRRAMADFGNRAGAGSAYFLIALMICFVIAELFLRLVQAYFYNNITCIEPAVIAAERNRSRASGRKRPRIRSKLDV